MWAALEATFGPSGAGNELYVMEQFYDYKMTDEHSVVQQTHEIQSLSKELEYFKCVLPDKFVVGTIIAKLPPSWNDFATSLKNKRAKDTRARVAEVASSAHMVHEKNFQPNQPQNNKNKSQGKGKFDAKNKPSHSTNFKKNSHNGKGYKPQFW